MARGTFANIRLRNALVPGKEGPYTVHLPDGEEEFIYDAALRYQREGTPLIVLAGREYGSGSSRDWAAKGPMLLGVRAVIAESFERIHRSNLVGMGVLPLQFSPGDSASKLGLTGRETYEIHGLADDLSPRKRLTVVARADPADGGGERRFEAIARLDGLIDVGYYRHGGILPAARLDRSPEPRVSRAVPTHDEPDRGAHRGHRSRTSGPAGAAGGGRSSDARRSAGQRSGVAVAVGRPPDRGRTRRGRRP